MNQARIRYSPPTHSSLPWKKSMPENFEKQSDAVKLHIVKADVGCTRQYGGVPFNSHLLDQVVKFRFEL